MSNAPETGIPQKQVRVRMRPYWLPAVILLCLLALSVLWLLRWGENRFYTKWHGLAHLEQLESSLHLLDHYEQEPPAIRWLSGIYGTGYLYREQDQMARHAERDGYLMPEARQTILLLAQRAGDNEGVAYWRDGPPGGIRQGVSPEDDMQWLRGMNAEYKPSAKAIVTLTGEWHPDLGRQLYWKRLQKQGITLAILIFLFPFGWRTIQLLRGKSANIPPVENLITAVWRPGIIFGGWIWAEWMFGLSGIAFSTLNYIAALNSNNELPFETPSFLIRLVAAYDTYISPLFNGPLGDVLAALLFMGPAILLSRRFAGGFMGGLEIFGVRPVPVTWRKILVPAAGGVWLTTFWQLLSGPAHTWLGWFDARDGWRHSEQHWYQYLFFAVLIAPLTEEWIFRGFLFRGFSRRWSPWLAALLSSSLFALMHAYSLPATIEVMLTGLLFCGLYQRTGTLWTPVIVHAASNLLLWAW